MAVKTERENAVIVVSTVRISRLGLYQMFRIEDTFGASAFCQRDLDLSDSSSKYEPRLSHAVNEIRNNYGSRNGNYS